MSATVPAPTTWTTGTTEGNQTGTWRTALPHFIAAPSPCHVACPVGGDIADWLGRARNGDLRAAWDVLTRHNPFPAVVGRVCHHPCEAACNRAAWDEPLAICRLERFVGDHALAAGWQFARTAAAPRPGRVAVVGGGPSGLSAAFQLCRRGHAVTLFESRRELGGLLRHGIPSYRLPRDVLDGEIARIVALGVDVRLETALDSPAALERMRAEHDAVYIAIGAGRPKLLPQLDYASHWVIDGADYLARTNAGAAPQLGLRVVVIGGGSAAMDVARSARRAGHAVTILSLERAAQMPAQREERIEAQEEGIALREGALVVAARATDDGEVALECCSVRFEPGTVRGTFAVTRIAGSDFTLAADAVIPAIGQDADLAPLGAALGEGGPLLDVDARQATSAARVYAGGDVTSMARFVSEAIAMGQRAALEIDRLLRAGDSSGEMLAPVDASPAPEPVVQLTGINTFYHAHERRPEERRLDPDARRRGNAEVQLPLAVEAALAEAGRCFSCGTCIHCDNCFHYCPDLAVARIGEGVSAGYRVLTDYCKGCGVCVRECPTGSMRMQEEVR